MSFFEEDLVDLNEQTDASSKSNTSSRKSLKNVGKKAVKRLRSSNKKQKIKNSNQLKNSLFKFSKRSSKNFNDFANLHLNFLKEYSLASLFVLLLILIKISFEPAIGLSESPFLFFVASVIASAWFGSLRSGIFSTILSCLAIDYLFFPPFYAFSIANPSQISRLILFFFEGTTLSWIISYLKWTRKKYFQAQNDLALQLEDMTLLNELGMKLTTNLELKDVLDEALKQAMDLQKADMGMIRFYNRERKDLYHVSNHGIPEEYLKEAERIPLEQSVSGEAVLQRKTFTIEDVQRNKNLALYKGLRLIKAESFCCTPLITRSGKIIGTINLYYKKVRHFQEREIALAEKYSKQAAEIIDDAVLYQEAQRSREETERINQALSKSEAFYKAVGESLPFGVWATDSKGHMTHISETYLKLIGQTFEQYKDFGWLKKLTSDSEKRTFKDWANCVKRGGFWEYNFKILDTNNMPHAVLSRGIPVKDGLGNVTGWAGINLDITDLKKNEEMLKLLSDSGIEFSASLDYEETFKSVAQMIVPHLADLCLVYLYEGKSLNRVTLSYGDNVDKNLVEEMSRHQKNPVKFKELHPVQVAIRTGQPQLVNTVTEAWLKNISYKEKMFEIRKKMGWQSYMAVPMIARGQTIGAVAFVSTTLGRKYTNSDLIIAEELANRAALAVDNARLYQKAKEAIRVRDEFLSIASHELKTPLTSLLLELELALQRIIESPGKSLSITQLARSIENAQWQSKRLNQLINNLLDLSRISAEKLGLVFQVLDLSDLAKDITNSLEEELKMSGYSLRLKTKKSVVGNWDKLRVEQIFTNLLTNAIKYGQGKPIEVTVNSDGSQAKLTVKDHGIGIPKKSLISIFSPYERATDSQQDQSLGMGLYITKQLVEAHSGKISVKSKPNEETTFIVELPLNSQRENGKVVQPKTQTEKENIIKEPLRALTG